MPSAIKNKYNGHHIQGQWKGQSSSGALRNERFRRGSKPGYGREIRVDARSEEGVTRNDEGDKTE